VEREAFKRAWRFLSYDRLAKWSAIVAAVWTGVLYVALLVVLGLFADLLVNRGRIPSFHDLPRVEQEDLLRQWQEGPGPQVEARWRNSGVRTILAEQVGAEAAERVQTDSEAGLADHGILSLVVRSWNRPGGRAVGWLARSNPWMWRHGNANHPFASYLPGLLLTAIGLALLRALCQCVMTYMAARATTEAATRLRRAVYHHTFRLGTLAFRALGPSEAVSVFTRHLEAVHDAMYTWLTVLYREPIKCVLLLAFALFVNFWLGLAFLLFALLVWLVGGQVAVYFRRQGRASLHRATEQLALIQESLMLMRLVKTYLMELFNQARVERQLARLARAQLRRYRGEAIYRPVLIFLGTLAAAVLLYVAGVVVLNGALGVAAGITLATALVSLYWPLVNLLEHRRVLRRGRNSAVVLFRFLDRPSEVGQVVGAEFLPPLTHTLEFDNVNLKEPGTDRVLLQGVSLRIPAGQRVALVGADETEKHALVYLLPRFLDPTTGEIRIDNHNLRWVTLDSLRAQLALVLQHNLIFNDTVANNIGCGDPSYTLPQIIEAAKVAHAHQFIQRLPKGYETPIGEMGHSLKIGEKFRIALARAVLRDPALLIIEEPATTMDDETKDLLDDTFARILAGRTVLFLPHRISTIRNCDRIYLLHKGKVEAAGAHRELLAHNDLYRHLHYIEFNELAEEIAEVPR
jgi:ATP-binding cassette subfamily B protein